MSILNDIRKVYDFYKNNEPGTVGIMVKMTDLDALFAIIDAQAAELAALRTPVKYEPVRSDTTDWCALPVSRTPLLTSGRALCDSGIGLIYDGMPEYEPAPTPPPADAPAASDTTAAFAAGNRVSQRDEIGCVVYHYTEPLGTVIDIEDKPGEYDIQWVWVRLDAGSVRKYDVSELELFYDQPDDATPSDTTPAAAAAQAAPFSVGDFVHYRYQGGWAGGETLRGFARVLKVNPKTAEIALFDERKRKAITKRVALSSLTPALPDYNSEAYLRLKMKHAGISLESEAK